MKKFGATTVFVLCTFIFALNAKTINVVVNDSELELPLEGVRLIVQGKEILGKTDTDINGNAALEIEDEILENEKVVITAQYPGYDDANVSLKKNQTFVEINLAIGGIIEGEEIVVQRSAGKKAEAETGISKVLEKEEIKTTAQIGLVEDVMSSVKTLPGVGYSATFSGERPSVRGGQPDEMTAVTDGVYLILPWQWGGAYSIFNPLMTDSVKLSHGIYSARYGKALSGLLEVTTIDPNPEKIEINLGTSTTSFDFLTQIPIGEHNSFMFGSRLTFLEGIVWMYDAFSATDKPLGEQLPTPPYIRDFYAKWKSTPTDKINFSVNAFLGTDGVTSSSEIKPNEADDDSDNLWGTSTFDYSGSLGYISLNTKYLATEQTQIQAIAAYNFQQENVDYYSNVQGTFEYSDDFIRNYDADDGIIDGKINGSNSYTLPNLETKAKEKITVHEIQGKIETDIELNSKNIIAFGGETITRFNSSNEFYSAWDEVKSSGTPVFTQVSTSIESKGNNVFQNAAFVTWEFGNESSLISGETGFRVDNLQIYSNEITVNGKYLLNPRFTIKFTPLRNVGNIESIAFSTGTGLFSQVNKMALLIDKNMNAENFDQDRLAMFVVGSNVKFKNDWNISLEGYYKYYLDRLFVAEEKINNTSKYDCSMDGKGRIFGLDAMLQKKGDGNFTGYISYSFIWEQFKNPYNKKYNDQTTYDEEPLDEWYYPRFHRFHTLNVVTNWKITQGFSMSVMGTLATGEPVKNTKNVTSYPVNMNGTIIQKYTRSSFYSDTLRSDISCPVDLKLSWKSKANNKKISWEAYFALEDVFVNLYSAEAGTKLNEFTGKETANEADFSIGLPIPSIGFKLHY